MNQVFKGVVFVVVDGDELDVDVVRDYLTNAVTVDLDTEQHGQPVGAEVVAVGLNWEELKRVTGCRWIWRTLRCRRMGIIWMFGSCRLNIRI